MTDPTARVLDPAEERLRRTFAVRAEDMAPGDGDDAPPELLVLHLPAVVPRSRRRPRLLQSAAALIVVALVAAGVALLRSGDGERGGELSTAGGAPADESPVGALTAPRGLIVALQDERNLATSRLVGIEDALAMPVTDTEEARSVTDAAVAAFDAFAGASTSGAAYEPVLDALDSLAELRGDVDAFTGPRTLDNLALSQEVWERYSAIVAGLLDTQLAYAQTIDEPAVGNGAVAYGRGLQLAELTGQLRRAGIVAVVVQGPEMAGELSRIRDELQTGLDALLADTVGTPFEQAATAAVGEVDGSGLLEPSGPTDGMIDISALLSAGDRMDAAWPAFLDSVEQTLGTQG